VRFRRLLSALARTRRWQPRSYPQVWCLAIGSGLGIALILAIAMRIGRFPVGAIEVKVAVLPTLWTLAYGATKSYRLSRRRDAAGDSEC
jgi:hypothetical protein